MPELPEVESARRLIADQALHRRIVDVDDSDSYVDRPHAPGELRSALTGRSLTVAGSHDICHGRTGMGVTCRRLPALLA